MNESANLGDSDVTDDDEDELIQTSGQKFEWGYLRKKCRNLELEHFYESYVHRLRMSSLYLFVVVEILAAFVYSAVLFFCAVQTSNVTLDIVVLIATAFAVWLVLSINFHEELVRRHMWIMYVTSWLAVTILISGDLFIPIFRAYTNQDILYPFGSAFILSSIYMLLPVPDNVQALILGIAVSICYLCCYGLITFSKHPYAMDKLNISQLLTELLFFILMNMLGIFFRMTKEITIRTTFLDRRQCVEENLLLRYARDQEKSLLLSIIPAQIANKIEQDVKMRIERMKMANTRRQSLLEGRKLFIEPHDDVSILYADVVNYTYLTTTLDVKTLVETLHDLFVRFDNASEEHNVLRIKFLGDCYYCVAGVPVPNEQHARCCVGLGLQMIKDIREVRQRRKLNIDMRIGVHSGNILSGVIGSCKWQFDIWSKDVDIAGRLEQTGVAGRVHVSEQTLKLLDGEYVYEEGTVDARNDPVLRKYRIHTFLIKPHRYSLFEPYMTRPSTSRYSVRYSSNANFMQNTILQYNVVRNQAKLEMSRELDKMPIGRIQFAESCFGRSKRLTQDELEERTFRSNITTLCLFFKDWRWEVRYMKEPDVMLKYSVLFGFFLLLGIAAMQVTSETQSGAFWAVTVFNIILLFGILVVSWYRKLWVMFIGETESSEPDKRISATLFRWSAAIKRNLVIRLILYLMLILMYCLTIFIQMADCDKRAIENAEQEILLFDEGVEPAFCFNAWGVTDSLVLVTFMSFLFTHIPFIVKVTVTLILGCMYLVIVSFEFNFFYAKSPTTNVGLYPEYAHLLMLAYAFVVFHLMERQNEFISKVDFNWKRQLLKKQEDAKFTNETIKILIHNILPAHVADIYMSKKIKEELYYEEYENVAVMFATIKNYDTDKVGLRVLNEIICDFDDMLNTYKRGSLKIEKIKVAGWTYMAACGLDITRSEYVAAHAPSFRNSSLLPNGRRSHYSGVTRLTREYSESSRNSSQDRSRVSLDSATQFSDNLKESASSLDTAKSRKISNPEQNNVLYIMTEFALDLMRSMHSFNEENMVEGKDCGMLRIGIANGEVMAGVVGSYKPHYDIWGNSVNLASRLDSTGQPGYIQVTEETANILQTFDIQCTFRGITYIKGIGEIPTFFVNIDNNLEFVHINNNKTQRTTIDSGRPTEENEIPKMPSKLDVRSDVSTTSEEIIMESSGENSRENSGEISGENSGEN